MITDFFIGLVVNLVSGLISALPSVPEPPDLAGFITSALSPGLEIMRSHAWIPVDQIGAGLLALGAWFLALYAVRFGAWVLALLHVAGTDAS